jgi:D-alanine--poly(phosphoribitol) ligase subunit 1
VTLFDRIVAAAPSGAVAIVSSEGDLTYGELVERAAALSQTFPAGPGSVLLFGHKEPSMVVAILAAVRSGLAYVPLDPSTPTERASRMISVAQPSLVLAARPVPSDLRSVLVERGIPIIDLGPRADAVCRIVCDVTAAGEPDPESAAYILFTSGTTGDPKGVAVPYRALDHFLSWLLTTYNFRTGQEVFLNQVPYTFDVSVVGLYGALLTGGTLFSVSYDEISNPRQLFARLDGAALTVWVSTPSLARICLAEPRFRDTMLPFARLFWLAGETLPPPMVRELYHRFPLATVWNAYGPTEATVVITAIAIDSDMLESGRPLPIGEALPGTRVWIADPLDPNRMVANGAHGEIVVEGPQVALGYLQPGSAPGEVIPPSATGAFFSRPAGGIGYRTGDLGHVDPVDGRFYCHGRLDRQVKLHGYRVELEEIETLLRDTPGIADAVVVVVERDGRPDHLVAMLVPAKDSDVPPLPSTDFALSQLVRSRLASRLPPYALPRAARVVDAPPLTTSGKLDRRALRAQLS